MTTTTRSWWAGPLSRAATRHTWQTLAAVGTFTLVGLVFASQLEHETHERERSWVSCSRPSSNSA
jgi:hypothetical protein